jgi:REP element-mobilizing transposase RayT
MPEPVPLYHPHRVDAAYHLRYSWTGWPSGGQFTATPTELLPAIAPIWKEDGLGLLEFRWRPDLVQLLFSTTPTVSPEQVAHRAKGRLTYALRIAGLNVPFSRKLAVRSLGDNSREEVEPYIEHQVGKEHFADPRFAQQMRRFTVVNPDVDLSQPSESARGRYWYNLHVVLVVQYRYRLADLTLLTKIRDTALRVAAKKEHLVSRLSIMPDHLHLALRAMPIESPADVVSAYQNNLAYALGQQPMWRESFYVGTFSEYNMNAVRRLTDRTATPPSVSADGERDRTAKTGDNCPSTPRACSWVKKTCAKSV